MSLVGAADSWLAAHQQDLVEWRRHFHRYPELGRQEHATTQFVGERLAEAGLNPKVLPGGTGLVCDIGPQHEPRIALRADMDALPMAELTGVPYASTLAGVAHACGHDAHTAILLGAATRLAQLPLPGTVRLIFQPAEESLPGGALAVLAGEVLDGAQQIFALHCDPRLEAGRIGVRVGPITAACDQVEVVLTGRGGHTARPHLTTDLVYALGRLITELPGMLSRRVDPRAALSFVWGAVEAGQATNAIPSTGRLRGTLRVFDRTAWHAAEPITRELITQIVQPTGAHVQTSYVRGVPPVVNDPSAVAVQRAAVLAGLGPDALAGTEQSMGGEDFAWYLDKIPGAMARLGVRAPGGEPFDLHQGTFDIDESALDVGVRYTVALAQAALAAAGRDAT